METTSISYLKTHLSAELKKVQNGVPLLVIDHRRPVATKHAVAEEDFHVREVETLYEFKPCSPLISHDLSRILDDEGLITAMDRLGQVLKGMNRCARALEFQTPLLA